MTRRVEYHRVLLDELAAWEAKGWRAAVTEGDAVGADHWCGGTLATTLVTRTVDQPECQGTCETCDCAEADPR